MPMQTLLQKVDRESPALFALVCMVSYSSGPRYTAMRFFFEGIYGWPDRAFIVCWLCLELGLAFFRFHKMPLPIKARRNGL